jgi:hypothetical protein
MKKIRKQEIKTMAKKHKSIGCILGIFLMTSMLNGCVAVALVPAVLNLAAEGVSVQTTGHTITENIRDAINRAKEDGKTVEVASLQHPGFPPRKPTPPQKQPEVFAISSPVGMIGQF